MQCTVRYENPSHKENLIDLVVKFIEFLNRLLDEGKITPGQYEELTKGKMEFLEHCNFDISNISRNYF